MISGANYHIFCLQILELGRFLKVSNIVNFFPVILSLVHLLQEFIQSFSSIVTLDCDSGVNLDPFLISISALTDIECSIQVLQTSTFIAGHSIN